MTEYLLELYVSGSGSTAADAGIDSIRAAAETVSSQGTPVRYVRSMFVAAEETCFVLLNAEKVEAIQAVARLAQLPPNRISEVVGGHGI